MRVLMVAHGAPGPSAGGTELYVDELAQTLKQAHGDEVMVFAREADRNHAEFTTRIIHRGGVTWVLVNNTYRSVANFEQTYRQPLVRARFTELLDTFLPEVAHVHHLTNLSTD